jgi:hypothetical protein
MAGNTATWAGDFFAPFPEEVHSRFSRDFPNIDMLRLMFRDAEKYGMEVGELRLTEISQDELAVDIYLIAKLIDSLIKAEAEAEALRADAERYRWLRENEQDRSDVFLACCRDELDAAIDAARKGE